MTVQRGADPLFRAEYVKLGTDLPRLARDFGVDLEPDTCRGALALALAMDTLDDAIDALAEPEQRATLYDAILVDLERGDPSRFGGVLRELSQAAVRSGCLPRLCSTVRRLMEVGEELRRETDPLRFIRLSRQEADVTVEMLFLVLGPRPDRFLSFLHSTGVVGNLADKLIDLGDDRRGGRARVAPSLTLYLAGLGEIVRAGLQVPGLHPRPLALLSWSWGYLSFACRYLTGLEPRRREVPEFGSNGAVACCESPPAGSGG
ncbi:MAG: hypothetical protein AB1758_32725 [Candidatus Eremiobacterota bacterium]